MTYEGDTT